MDQLSQQLKTFERRVRLVRSWRGLAAGVCAGAALGLVWAGLDWFRVLYTEWTWLGLLVAGCGVIGALIGFFQKVPSEALADSIDRRGGLANRLATAREHSGEAAFDQPLLQDAETHLEGLRPRQVFPVRLGRWQAGAAALCAVTAAIFLLGNTPLLLDDDAKREREELKKEGAKVERIRKENLENQTPKDEMTEEEKRLADELRKFQRDLEKGRLTKEESLQKSNEIAKKADELMRKSIENTKLDLQKAESALDKLRKAAMEKAGMKQMDASLMKMSPQQREQAMQQKQDQISELQSEMSSMQSQMSALEQKLKDPKLSEAE